MLNKLYTFIILYHIIIYYLSLSILFFYLYKYRYLYKLFINYFIALFNVTIIELYILQYNFFI